MALQTLSPYINSQYKYSDSDSMALFDGKICFEAGFAPLVKDCFVFILCENGHLSIKEDNRQVSIQKQQEYEKWVGTEVKELNASPDFSGHIFIASADCIMSATGAYYYPLKQSIFLQPVLTTSERNRHIFTRFYDLAATILCECGYNENLDSLLKGFISSSVPNRAHITRTTLDPLITSLISLMENDCDYSYSLEHYSKLLGVSNSQLALRIKKELGMTFSQYKKRRILRLALTLINTGNLPVGKIADRLGFSEVSNFSRFIKNETGLSPSEIERRVLK